jgi:hypothetical protein
MIDTREQWDVAFSGREYATIRGIRQSEIEE